MSSFTIRNNCNVLFIGSTKSGKTSTFIQACKQGLIAEGKAGTIIIVAPNISDSEYSIQNVSRYISCDQFISYKNLREFVHQFRKLKLSTSERNLLIFDDFQSDLHSLKSNVKQKNVDDYLENNRSLDDVYSELQIFEKIITENMNHGNFIQIFMLQKFDLRSPILKTLSVNTQKYVIFVDQASGKRSISDALVNIDPEVLNKLDIIRKMSVDIGCKNLFTNLQGQSWFISFPVIFDKEADLQYYLGLNNKLEL